MESLQTPQRLVRAFIVTTNITTLIFGAALATIGVAGLSNLALKFLGSYLYSWILISSGITVILISIFSCTPTLTESKRLIVINGAVIALLAISEFILVVYYLVQDNKIDSRLGHVWQDSYDYMPRKLKEIEKELTCCGFSSVDDRAVPKSSPFACRDSASFGYHISCHAQLKNTYKKFESSSLICLVSILVLQLLVLVALVLHWYQVPVQDEINAQAQDEYSRSLLRGWQQEDEDNRQHPAGENSQQDERTRYGSINNQSDQ